ncbi:MAG: site-2 protease family protein [Candidatus Helarchaeota archaeon]|nr:site-2 protease family protein [Candidatus Helarchaeota archaeon]
MGYYQYDQPVRQIRFGRREIQDLFIATIVVSIAFAIALSSGLTGIVSINWGEFPLALLISFLAIGSGFILHELGHKFLAIRYGAWAEFRAWPMGLMMALMFALIAGVVFAAPGAVMVMTPINKEQFGKTALMGPVINIVFAGIFLPLTLITFGTIYTIFFYIYYINAFLAVFNLLPIPPLDGSKIARWSVPIYILALIASIGLLVPAYLP